MALALILDSQNLNPGHIHYVNLGKPLKLSFIFLIYKMKMVIIIIKLHNSLYPTPLGPGVFRNSEILKCLEYHTPYITCRTTWPGTLTLLQKMDDHSHQALNFVFFVAVVLSLHIAPILGRFFSLMSLLQTWK